MGQARKGALGRGRKKPWAEICVCIGMGWQRPGSQRHFLGGETRERVRYVLESLDASSGVDIIFSASVIRKSYHEESATSSH